MLDIFSWGKHSAKEAV